MAQERGRLIEFGCWISEKVSDIAANPFVQLGVLLFCIAWFAFGLPVDILTAALSILAITLTQMVLNRQQDREKDAHRRDVALHAKLDELLHASKRARDELVGIEELEEEEIAELVEEKVATATAASEDGDEDGEESDGDSGAAAPKPRAKAAG
jgi:low affinity Fe/Cu permease